MSREKQTSTVIIPTHTRATAIAKAILDRVPRQAAAACTIVENGESVRVTVEAFDLRSAMARIASQVTLDRTRVTSDLYHVANALAGGTITNA